MPATRRAHESDGTSAMATARAEDGHDGYTEPLTGQGYTAPTTGGGGVRSRRADRQQQQQQTAAGLWRQDDGVTGAAASERDGAAGSRA